VIGGTCLLWFIVMALAARSVGLSVWSPSRWGRWNSGRMSSAKNGYIFEKCVDAAEWVAAVTDRLQDGAAVLRHDAHLSG
jgi:hypothetical protein